MNEEYIKKYFKFDCDPIADEEAVVEGDNFRFTILTSKLIRMEYNKTCHFEDRPTQTVWFRKQKVPDYVAENDGKKLTIETSDLKLTYKVSKKFNRFSLKIDLKDFGKTWRYGKRERGNLNGTLRTLDPTLLPKRLKKGLLSKDGFATLDDSNSLVFDENCWLKVREESCVDLYFFGYGRNYLECLTDYYKISGKTPMIPRYILGNWWSRYWEYDEKELKELINKFQKYEIPLSVCIIDMDWHLVNIDEKYGSGWTGYTWNKELFPDPVHMLDWLHQHDLKVSLNLHPADGIRPHEESYDEVADFMGVDKSKDEPVEFDIADPKFVSAYFDLVHHPLEEQGVDFWWIDWQQGKKTNMEGLDPLWMLNHLHFYDQGRTEDQRSFIFSRWGGFGNHRYPIGFSGDTATNWKLLDFLPYFTVTASNVGYGWWSHDIGGHMLGKESAELFTRWVQFGTFSPVLRLHSTKKKFHKREPWRYDVNTLTYVSEAMRFRHQLIPYIYTMAYVNYSQDVPLMRPLYYYEPYESEAYDNPNEYWYGNELIVHPITKKMHKKFGHVLHETYLPHHAGGYFNIFSKEYHEGGKSHLRAYKLNEIPAFAKAGAIIPLADDDYSNGTDNPTHLRVEIYPGGTNQFSLYEDEGDSERYRQGKFHLTNFGIEWNEEKGEKSAVILIKKQNEKLPFIPEERRYTLVVNCISVVEDISIESDTKEDVKAKLITENNQILIEIPSNDFSEVKVSLKDLEIKKEQFINQNCEDLLMDSKITTLSKILLDRFAMKKDQYSEKDLKSLYRKIWILH